jgi:hypothetical protein
MALAALAVAVVIALKIGRAIRQPTTQLMPAGSKQRYESPK